ncbi:MAG: FAD-binding protein [Bauldia sp.]
MRHTNWAGNLVYSAAAIAVPESLAEARQIVRAAGKLRVLGSRHCFNDIADTPGVHLSLARLNRIVSLDRARAQVTVEGGIRYGELGPWLHGEGFALHNLASLPHISIAGAVATATHGSGAALGCLATAVAAVEFIDAEGELITLSREQDPDTFPGAVVSLGALGAVTKLTLDVEPAFSVRQDVWRDLPFAALEANFDAIMSAGYSVSLFTNWQGETIGQAWIKSRTGAADHAPAAPDFFGAHAARANMHPIAHHEATHATGQMGAPGPWHDRLPHFRMGFSPSSGEELQAEYLLPRQHAVAAVEALRRLGDRLAPLLMVSEIRTVAADDLWLSPFYHQPAVAFHFTFRRDWPALAKLLPVMEEALTPFLPHPHWGKVFTLAPEAVQAGYPKLPDFRALLAAHDPNGKFRNAFVNRYVVGTDEA